MLEGISNLVDNPLLGINPLPLILLEIIGLILFVIFIQLYGRAAG